MSLAWNVSESRQLQWGEEWNKRSQGGPFRPLEAELIGSVQILLIRLTIKFGAEWCWTSKSKFAHSWPRLYYTCFGYTTVDMPLPWSITASSLHTVPHSCKAPFGPLREAVGRHRLVQCGDVLAGLPLLLPLVPGDEQTVQRFCFHSQKRADMLMGIGQC